MVGKGLREYAKSGKHRIGKLCLEEIERGKPSRECLTKAQKAHIRHLNKTSKEGYEMYYSDNDRLRIRKRPKRKVAAKKEKRKYTKKEKSTIPMAPANIPSAPSAPNYVPKAPPLPKLNKYLNSSNFFQHNPPPQPLLRKHMPLPPKKLNPEGIPEARAPNLTESLKLRGMLAKKRADKKEREFEYREEERSAGEQYWDALGPM